MNVARYLVQGCDVWLNNPRRPLEASGTSGMKAAANGILNLSVLDGWWCEGYSNSNGWAIGAGEEYDDEEEQDNVESMNLYDLLEDEVIPLFYKRGVDGLPRGWISKMKECISTISPVFNTSRMVAEYTTKFYIPCFSSHGVLAENNFEKLRVQTQWENTVRAAWSGVSVRIVSVGSLGLLKVGDKIEFQAGVNLNGLTREDVTVELFYGTLDNLGNLERSFHVEMEQAGMDGNDALYKVSTACEYSGKFGYAVRVLPSRGSTGINLGPKLIVWNQD
jgi:glycogen phosphorylase